MSDQLRIGSALARFFSAGGGPSHSAISSAFMAAGYEEPHIDRDQNKQERVNSAFRRTVDSDIQHDLVREIFVLLFGEGYLENVTNPVYKILASAIQNAGMSLDKHGFLVEKEDLIAESNQGQILSTRIDESVIEPRDTQATRRVLISHAESDNRVADEIARFIGSVCGLDKKQILCTSVDGYRLDPGEEWLDALQRSIRDGDLIVFLISSAFMTSDFCGFELGAAWMAEDQYQRFPMRFPDVPSARLTALPGAWHCPPVSDDALSLLVDRIVQRCGLQRPSANYVTSELGRTMRNLTSIWGTN